MTDKEILLVENLNVFIDKSKPRPTFHSGDVFAEWWWKVLNPRLKKNFCGKESVLEINGVEVGMTPDHFFAFKNKQSALDAGDFLAIVLREMGRINEAIRSGYLYCDFKPNKKPAE